LHCLASSSELQREVIGIYKTGEEILNEHKFFFTFSSLRGLLKMPVFALIHPWISLKLISVQG